MFLQQAASKNTTLAYPLNQVPLLFLTLRSVLSGLMNKNNSSENCEMEGLMSEKKTKNKKKQPMSKVLKFQRPKYQRAIAQENFK